jgi:hypothetical protein
LVNFGLPGIGSSGLGSGDGIGDADIVPGIGGRWLRKIKFEYRLEARRFVFAVVVLRIGKWAVECGVVN